MVLLTAIGEVTSGRGSAKKVGLLAKNISWVHFLHYVRPTTIAVVLVNHTHICSKNMKCLRCQKGDLQGLTGTGDASKDGLARVLPSRWPQSPPRSSLIRT